MKKILLTIPLLFAISNAEEKISFKELVKNKENLAYIYSPRTKSCQLIKEAFNSKTTKDGLKTFARITGPISDVYKKEKGFNQVIVTTGKYKNVKFSLFSNKESCFYYKQTH